MSEQTPHVADDRDRVFNAETCRALRMAARRLWETIVMAGVGGFSVTSLAYGLGKLPGALLALRPDPQPVRAGADGAISMHGTMPLPDIGTNLTLLVASLCILVGWVGLHHAFGRLARLGTTA